MSLYNFIMYCVQPFIWIRLLLLSLKTPKYRRHWNERYGFYNRKIKSNGIIIHSVSVGETLAAVSLVRFLHQYYPHLSITVTTMTPSSRNIVSKLYKNINYMYLPYDLSGSIHRFLNLIQPKLVIIMETELWPNLIKALYDRHIPLIIANARISYKSFMIYKKFIPFIIPIMSYITFVAAQNEEHGLRFLKLGLEKERLFIIGNLKFDIEVNTKLLAQACMLRRQLINNRQVWIAASTHTGEEKLLLHVHHQLLKIFPSLLLILVPRHPSRFLKVREMVSKYNFNYMLRSSKYTPSSKIQIIIVDTIGELMLFYGISDLAFIGGSLIKHGGHNPLEAAAHAIPIIMGPYTFNFNDICNKLRQAHGLITITNISSLTSIISQLLTDNHYRLNCGVNAIKVLHHNQGVLKKLLNLIQPLL